MCINQNANININAGMNGSFTFRKLLRKGIKELGENGISEKESDAKTLLEYVFNIDKATLYLDYDKDISDKEKIEKFLKLIAERCKRIPLQHITGRADFFGYEFVVNSDVLVPRFDTENLCVSVIDIITKMYNLGNRNIKVLDMCTGSGCIGISIEKYLREEKNIQIEIDGFDISDKALKVANLNKEKLGSNINFYLSDLYEKAKDKKYDFIVSNPPYIRTKEIEKLEEEVKTYDPFIALDGKEDGLFFYRKITMDADKYLNVGGYLCFEIGYDQAEDVRSLMENNKFSDIKVYKDLSGLDRVVIGKLDSL